MDTADTADLQSALSSLLDQPPSPAQLGDLQDLGKRLYETGQLEAALTAFEALVDRGMTDNVSCWQTITGLRLQLQLPRRALDAAQCAVALAPESADAWYNLGLLLGETGDDTQALAAYEHALSIDASHYGSMRNRPLLLARMGRQEEAKVANQALLLAYPDDPWLHFNSGDLLIGMRAADRAEAAFRRALALAPDFHCARYALSLALAAQGRVREAEVERAAALAEEPRLTHTYKSPLAIDEGLDAGEVSPARVAVLAAFEELRVGDWHRYAEIVDMYAGLVRGEYGNPPLDQFEMPHCALLLAVDDDVRRQVARQAARRVQLGMIGKRLVRPPRHADKALRIAYLSPDFRPHPTSRLMGRLYARHDRSRFKVHAYSLGPVEDCPERRSVMEGADVFRDLGSLPVQAAAQLIVNDGIDILIDLAGYTRHARPEIAALRPAPIQVAYLGFPGTMGAPWIDYTLLDHQSLSSEERKYWDEKIAWLPHHYLHCEMPQAFPQPPSRAELGLPESGLILGALHHPRKLEPVTWQCWMELLKLLPDASLWLLYETEEQRQNLLRNAEQYGIASSRLILSGLTGNEDHLRRLGQADIFLDLLVCNGHTTTVDALAAGVPVVTLRGVSLVARVAGSMLKAHGLPELVTESVEEYRQLVVRLAADKEWRLALRKRVSNYANSNLFCPERKLAQIETACEMMWARYQAGRPPEDFDVPE